MSLFPILVGIVFYVLFKLMPLIFSPPAKVEPPKQNTEETVGDYADQKTTWTEKKDQKMSIVCASTVSIPLDNSVLMFFYDVFMHSRKLIDC